MQSAYERRVAGAQTPVPEPSARLHGDVADWLNRCLRTELSAVETYDLAIAKIGRTELTNILQQIRASHDLRAVILREYLVAAGCQPAQSSGVWGAFAKAVQAGADLLGDRTAMTALEQFENHAAQVYADRSVQLDQTTRSMVDTQLVPEQTRTTDLSNTLLHFVQTH